MPKHYALHPVGARYVPIQSSAIRAHYYTSLKAAQDDIEAVKQKLRSLGFDPNVFKKERQEQKAKGVDIALTKDMLSHAFLSNYETAVLIAGDGDYLPLVEEVKRLGKRVLLAFFDGDFLNSALIESRKIR